MGGDIAQSERGRPAFLIITQQSNLDKRTLLPDSFADGGLVVGVAHLTGRRFCARMLSKTLNRKSTPLNGVSESWRRCKASTYAGAEWSWESLEPTDGQVVQAGVTTVIKVQGIAGLHRGCTRKSEAG